jgi:hypothetical protein
MATELGLPPAAPAAITAQFACDTAAMPPNPDLAPDSVII